MTYNIKNCPLCGQISLSFLAFAGSPLNILQSKACLLLLIKAVSRGDSASPEAGLEEPKSLGPPYQTYLEEFFDHFLQQSFSYRSCPTSHKNYFLDVAFSFTVIPKSTPPNGRSQFTPFITRLINLGHQFSDHLVI